MPKPALLRLCLPLVVLAGCSTGPGPDVEAPAPIAATRDDVLVPNEHLRIEGIPPVPKALVAAVGKYTDFKPVNVVAWHPERRSLLVAYRHGATTQLHLLDQPMGTLEPLTDFPDPVGKATFEPKHGAYLVYERDTGGNEAAQLYRYDFATKQSTLLTDPSGKHAFGAWNHAGTTLLMTSTQLDRTGKRDSVTTDLSVIDPLHPDTKRKIASLPGGGWEEFRWAANDKALYAIEYRSATESVVWKIDADDGVLTRVLPSMKSRRDPKHTVAFGNLHLARDGKRLVYTSDESGEFSQLMVMDLAHGTRRALTNLPGDVEAVVMHGEDGAPDPGAETRVRSEPACAVVNVAGRRELHVVDLQSGRELALPSLPAAARSGSLSRLRFRRGTDEIAFTVNSAQSPGDVYTLDLRSRASGSEQWTRAVVDGVDTTPFREAEIVQWKSFDGRAISGLINRPPTRFTGKRPVLVNIHGGPEGQSTIGFLGRNNYLVDELGVAYIQPNVRGSMATARPTWHSTTA